MKQKRAKKKICSWNAMKSLVLQDLGCYLVICACIYICWCPCSLSGVHVNMFAHINAFDEYASGLVTDIRRMSKNEKGFLQWSLGVGTPTLRKPHQKKKQENLDRWHGQAKPCKNPSTSVVPHTPPNFLRKYISAMQLLFNVFVHITSTLMILGAS